MSDSYIQGLFAERIGGKQYGKSNAIYKFEKIKRAKKAAKEANPDVDLIDMGVGEPDEMAFPVVVKALQDAAARPEYRGYADNGGDEFKMAASRYLSEVFGVKDIDPKTEVVHSIGSKTALTMIPACFVNPGDFVLMTVPGYPVLGTHTKYLGGQVYNMPLEKKNDFLPDLDAVPTDVLAKAKIMVLNYPNKAVAFAKANNLIIVQDAAYASLIFEGKPLSILKVAGAKDVAIELHSLSKSYNMTGWRIGFVVGNALIVKAYADMKDNSDSGQFLAIQKAASVALANPDITESIAKKYSRRMDLLVNVLNQQGFEATKPQGSFFLYVAAPKSATTADKTITFETGEAFSQWLIKEELISTVPWDDCGNFVRFSVTFAAQGEAAEKDVIAEIGSRLSKYTFEF
jgi:LL-diaminopimelate aminotransferase